MITTVSASLPIHMFKDQILASMSGVLALFNEPFCDSLYYEAQATRGGGGGPAGEGGCWAPVPALTLITVCNLGQGS